MQWCWNPKVPEKARVWVCRDLRPKGLVWVCRGILSSWCHSMLIIRARLNRQYRVSYPKLGSTQSLNYDVIHMVPNIYKFDWRLPVSFACGCQIFRRYYRLCDLCCLCASLAANNLLRFHEAVHPSMYQCRCQYSDVSHFINFVRPAMLAQVPRIGSHIKSVRQSRDQTSETSDGLL